MDRQVLSVRKSTSDRPPRIRIEVYIRGTYNQRFWLIARYLNALGTIPLLVLLAASPKCLYDFGYIDPTV